VNRIKILTDFLEKTYPSITNFVYSYGWIEIGQDENSSSFIKAFNEGGDVWIGADNYESLDAALQDLESALCEWLKEVE
jgi:hypothetical protein